MSIIEEKVLEKLLKELNSFKSDGFREIKIIKNYMMKDGNPILLVSEKDYGWLEEKLKKEDEDRLSKTRETKEKF